MVDFVQLSQQFIEVAAAPPPTDKVQLSQQYVEVVAAILAPGVLQLSQQYLEVISAPSVGVLSMQARVMIMP